MFVQNLQKKKKKIFFTLTNIKWTGFRKGFEFFVW
jgi:hypothetical protein